MAIIEMKNLWKEYGDQVVLERLNATVQEGEFVTVVGAIVVVIIPTKILWSLAN